MSISGPAVLAGKGSAKSDSTERFDASTCTTFDGRALAIIRPTGAGSIVVSVQAEGMGDAHVRIESLGAAQP